MSEAVKGFSVVNHVGITVSNLDESVKFYEALTGTKIANRDEIGGKRMAQTQGLDDTLIKYANVHLENINIDLLEYVKPKSEKASYSNEQISAMHMCFEVEDIDAAVARLRRRWLEERFWYRGCLLYRSRWYKFRIDCS